MGATPESHYQQDERIEAGDADLEKNLDYIHDLATFQTLLQRGRVDEAVDLLKELETRWPQSEQIRRAARIFAPSVARVVKNGPRAPSREQIRKEQEWLRANRKKYPNCWVVIEGDQLLGWHRELRKAIEEAERAAKGSGGSLYHIPASAVDE